MFDKKLFQHVNARSGGTGEGGTNDYKQLINKPQVNGVTLNGNKTAEDLNLLSKDTEQEVTGNKNFTGTLQYKGEEVATASALTTLSGKVTTNEEAISTLNTTLENKADKTELPVKATNETLGLVKPDGTTITVKEDGTLSTGEVTANNVAYSNGEYTSVKEALDALLYVAPTVQFTQGGSSLEIGASLENVTVKWRTNKDVTTQVLKKNNVQVGELTATDREYTDTGANITTNTTYTITVGDGKKTATASANITFRPKRYWGVSTSATLDNAGVLALSGELCNDRAQTRTFNCSGGKYFYIVLPKNMCNNITFKVGGLAFSDMEVTEIQLTNESGYTQAYNIYRPTEIQTGSAITVNVA